MIDSASDDNADYALAITDVSAHRWSRARRLMRSVATLGLLRDAPDVDQALSKLTASLEAAGFHVVECSQPSDGNLYLLLRGSEAKLQREFHREQLDAWIQARTRGEFVPLEAPPEGFTPARRIALLRPPLFDLLPRLRSQTRSDLISVNSAFALHSRRFGVALLSHLCRRFSMQAHMLHSLRNESGEKVAFLFAFRTHYQRWLVLPAALGVALWLCRLVSSRLPSVLTPLFGLCIPVWATLLLESWRSKQRELALLWGVDALREAEVARPDFRGERVVSMSGAARLHYPAWKRRLKHCVTVPILGAQLLGLTAIVTCLYTLWIAIHESNHHRALKTLLVVLVSAAWGACPCAHAPAPMRPRHQPHARMPISSTAPGLATAIRDL